MARRKGKNSALMRVQMDISATELELVIGDQYIGSLSCDGAKGVLGTLLAMISGQSNENETLDEVVDAVTARIQIRRAKSDEALLPCQKLGVTE